MEEILFLITDDSLNDLVQIDNLMNENEEHAGFRLTTKYPETDVYFEDAKLNNFMKLNFIVDTNRVLNIYQGETLILTCNLAGKFISIIKIGEEAIQLCIKDLSDLTERSDATFEIIFRNYGNRTMTGLLYRPVNKKEPIMLDEDNFVHDSLDLENPIAKVQEYIKFGKVLERFVPLGDLRNYYMYLNGRLYNIISESIEGKMLSVEPIGENLGCLAIDLSLIEEPEKMQFINKSREVIYENMTMDGRELAYTRTPYAILENIYKKFKMALCSPGCPIEPLEDYKKMFDETLDKIFSIDGIVEILQQKGYVFINHGEIISFSMDSINYLLEDMDENIRAIKTMHEEQQEVHVAEQEPQE